MKCKNCNCWKCVFGYKIFRDKAKKNQVIYGCVDNNKGGG